MENQEQTHRKTSWVIFTGCMFIGMGIGAIFDQTGTGMFIGMGAGFLLSGLLELRNKK